MQTEQEREAKVIFEHIVKTRQDLRIFEYY